MGEAEQENVVTSTQSPIVSAKSEKRKVRRRKKKLFKSIRYQMEFYFSDANLRKDRYMSELVHKDEEGYVDLEVFLTFHKIRALTADVKDIAAAISSSEMLQMDDAHKRVRRCTELAAKPDVDECTLYVERLPLHADHAWLKGVFSRHGQVLYVSLPRYRHNNRIKGFAFIEFASPEDVDRACRHFGYQDVNSKKPEATSEPTAEPTAMSTAKSTASADEVPTVATSEEKVEDEDGPPAKRRKQGGSSSTGGGVAPHPTPQEEAAGSSSEAESSDAGEALEDDGEDADAQVSSGAAKKKKKTRKRKKKSQQHSEAKEPHSLVVMPKCEWKRLRNKYLALQKATMAQIKRTLMLPPSGNTPMPSPSHSALTSPAPGNMAEEEAGADDAVPGQGSRMEVGSCDAEERDNQQGTQAPTLDFQPGVIIKLLTEKPVSNTTEFKNNIRQLANVAYVDVMEGDSVAYVRCANAEAACQFIEKQKDSFCGSLALLTGDEEKTYWDKITLDRETRRSQKTRQKKRGVEKVIAKAQKMMQKKNQHIRFDDL